MTKLTLRRPDDWHLHLRDGDMLRAVLPESLHSSVPLHYKRTGGNPLELSLLVARLGEQECKTDARLEAAVKTAKEEEEEEATDRDPGLGQSGPRRPRLQPSTGTAKARRTSHTRTSETCLRALTSPRGRWTGSRGPSQRPRPANQTGSWSTTAPGG